jgi:hypothetical protein
LREACPAKSDRGAFRGPGSACSPSAALTTLIARFIRHSFITNFFEFLTLPPAELWFQPQAPWFSGLRSQCAEGLSIPVSANPPEESKPGSALIQNGQRSPIFSTLLFRHHGWNQPQGFLALIAANLVNGFTFPFAAG